MDIRNLNTFLKISELLNFTRAAEELGYSQSSVSAQIRQLEKDVGAPLFNRIGKYVSLTQYGEEMIPYAQQIISASMKMKTGLKSPKDLEGTIRIGAVESVSNCLMEDALLEFHRDFPNVKIEISVDSTVALKANLRQGRIDAACVIDDPPSESEWQCRASMETPIVIAAGVCHPLAGKKRVRPEELMKEPFVLMEDQAPYCVHFRHLAASGHWEPNVFLKLQSANTACRLISRGSYLSVLPLYSVQPYIDGGQLCTLNVPELAQKQTVQLLMHPGKIATPQVSGFLEKLEENMHSRLVSES